MRLAIALAAVGLLTQLAACTPAPSADASISNEVDGNALRPKLPLMLDHHGGVIAAPEVYTVVWKGDEALGAAVDRFYAALMADRDYWGVLAQYGVTGGRARGVIVVPEASTWRTDPSWDQSELVDSLVAAGTLPKPGPMTVFALLPPATTKLDGGCSQFGGFHNATVSDTVYTVALRCDSTDKLDDSLSLAASHELAEAVADPYPFTKPAWLLGDAEIADLCNQLPTRITTAAGETATATRLYSNAAAARDHGGPCVPAPPDEAYFNIAFPDRTTILLDATGNGTATLTLSPFADAGMTDLGYSFAHDVDHSLQHPDGTSVEVTFSKDGAQTYSTPLVGNATPGMPFAVAIKVRGARPEDAEVPLTLVAWTGAISQVWSGTLVLTR